MQGLLKRCEEYLRKSRIEIDPTYLSLYKEAKQRSNGNIVVFNTLMKELRKKYLDEN
jgi:hypothetical protein